MKYMIRALVLTGVLAALAWTGWDHATGMPAGAFTVACAARANVPC